MLMYRRLTAKETALAACFTGLYVVLSFLPMFQIVGLFKAITATTVIAPIIGIVLGAYLGVISTFLGGIVGLFLSPVFSQPSFAAGIVAALCASLLYTNRRFLCGLIYLALLFAFGFYPSVGPVWLFPLQMWFQIAGLLILLSPLQFTATKNLNSDNNPKSLSAFFITFLTSTLASQIAGSLVFEIVFWPNIIPNISTWQSTWIGLTALYPVERTTIAFLAALTGVAVHRALKSTNLLTLPSHGENGRLRRERGQQA